MVQVGQKVVCVESTGTYYPNEVGAMKGTIYTIRDVLPYQNGIGIRLVEIKNPTNKFNEGFMEISFCTGFFRPIVERKTDTSFAILEDIRRKASKKQPLKVSA